MLSYVIADCDIRVSECRGLAAVFAPDGSQQAFLGVDSGPDVGIQAERWAKAWKAKQSPVSRLVETEKGGK